MATRLVFLFAPDSEPAALDIDAQTGKVLARGPLASFAAKAERIVLAVPGAQVIVRWIDLPARTEAQARSAAAFLLEDELATPRDQTHIALGPVEGDGKRMVAVVDKTVMSGWLARARALDLKPDVVAPDHLLVAPPEAEDVVSAVPLADMIVLRGRALAASCEPDLAPLLIGTRTLVTLEAEAAAEAAFAMGALAPPLSLLQGEFAPRRESRAGDPRGWRLAAALGLAVTAAPLLTEAIRFVRHQAGAEAAASRAAQQARAALPADLAETPDPVREARARLEAQSAGQSGGFLGPTTALFAAIERAPTMQLSRLAYAAQDGVRASVTYGDYSEVDLLRAALLEAGYVVQEGGSTSAEGRVSTELVIRPGS